MPLYERWTPPLGDPLPTYVGKVCEKCSASFITPRYRAPKVRNCPSCRKEAIDRMMGKQTIKDPK